MKKIIYILYILVIYLFSTNAVYSLKVKSYYGHYDFTTKKPGKIATSLGEPVVEDWQAPGQIAEPYTIGILFPHLKDDYWLGINYGFLEEAKKLGVNIKILSAGGYSKGGVQRRQLTNELIKEKVNGIIIGSIFYDKLDRFIAQVTGRGIPVVAIANDILAPTISAKVMVSHYDIGYKIGEHVILDSAGRDIKVAVLPGPKASGWAADIFAGFTQIIRDNPSAYPLGKVTIVAEKYGAIDVNMQTRLVDFVLNAKENIDYLIGNPVAARVAPTIVAKYKEKHPNLKIISTFMIPELYPLIEDDLIATAITDLPIYQARIALDLMVRTLNGEHPGDESTKLPFRTAPDLHMITKKNLKDIPIEDLFVDQEYEPVYQFVSQNT